MQRRPKIEQSIDVAAMSRRDEIGGDHHVLINELGRLRVVGENSPDLGRRDIDRVRPIGAHPAIDFDLLRQIERAAIGDDDLTILPWPSRRVGAEPLSLVASNKNPLAGEREDHLSHRAIPAKSLQALGFVAGASRPMLVHRRRRAVVTLLRLDACRHRAGRSSSASPRVASSSRSNPEQKGLSAPGKKMRWKAARRCDRGG